ncbi:MAG TPA: DinB family protein [Chloroflexota bacterium]|jgi:hypothetical protein
MTADSELRTQLLALLTGEMSRSSFDEVLEEFPLDRINEPVPHSEYTPWRLLEHMRIGQRDILDYVRDPKYVSPPWPQGYWPPEGVTADPAQWRASLEGFRADLAALEAMVRDSKVDLLAPLPHAPTATLLREIILTAGHVAFHLGEFAAIREMQQTWPAGHQ